MRFCLTARLQRRRLVLPNVGVSQLFRWLHVEEQKQVATPLKRKTKKQTARTRMFRDLSEGFILKEEREGERRVEGGVSDIQQAGGRMARSKVPETMAAFFIISARLCCILFLPSPSFSLLLDKNPLVLERLLILNTPRTWSSAGRPTRPTNPPNHNAGLPHVGPSSGYPLWGSLHNDSFRRNVLC